MAHLLAFNVLMLPKDLTIILFVQYFVKFGNQYIVGSLSWPSLTEIENLTGNSFK